MKLSELAAHWARTPTGCDDFGAGIHAYLLPLRAAAMAAPAPKSSAPGNDYRPGPLTCDRRALAVAVHEAGHAVGFADEGVIVSAVVLTHRPAPDGRSKVTGGRCDVLGDFSAVPCWCGFAASRMARLQDVDDPARYARDDRAAAAEAVHRRRWRGSPAYGLPVEAEIRQVAAQVVYLHRRAVHAIADALLASGHLEGPQLDALLLPVRTSASGPRRN